MGYKQRHKCNYNTRYDKYRFLGIIGNRIANNKRSKDNEKQGRNHKPRLMQHILQIFIIVLQGALVVITWRLVESANKQADAALIAAQATQESAKATLQSVIAIEKSGKISEQSMQIANRAYLSIYSIKPDKIEDFSSIDVKVKIVNTGQTPAYNVEGIYAISIMKALPDNLPVTNKPPLKSTAVLGRNGTAEIPLIKTFNDVQQLAMKSNRAFLVFTGTVRYLDIFKHQQFFEFNFFYDIKSNTYNYCQKHNDAS